MSYGDNKLYLYEDYIDLVVDTNGLYVDNRPMNNRKLIAHKGLTNEIFFKIRNRDRKLQNVFSDILTATLINPSTKRRFFYKVLEHTSEVGIAKLVLDEGDLRDISAGLYTIYIARRKSDSLDYPIYTDQNSNLKFEIEISEQIDQSPVDTQIANSFTQTASVGSGDVANVFVTPALYGNQDRNFSQALHSLAIYPSAYTGNISIQGSCIEGVPNSDDASSDWFLVEKFALTTQSTIVHRTFQVNANWIRIIHTPDSGTISQVQLRN